MPVNVIKLLCVKNKNNCVIIITLMAEDEDDESKTRQI